MRLFSLYRLLRPTGFRLKKRFRLIDQLIGFFVLIVLVPLLILTFSIYNINQKAVKKQVRHFTEYTVDAAYQQLNLELTWQKNAASHLVNDWERIRTLGGQQQANESKKLFALYPNVRFITYRYGGHEKLWTPLNSEQQIAPAIIKAMIQRPEKRSAEQNNSLISIQLSEESPQHYGLHFWVQSPHHANGTWHIYSAFPFLEQLIANNQNRFHQDFALISDNGSVIAGTHDFKNGELPGDLLTKFQKLNAGERLDISQDSASEENSSDNFGGEKSHQILIKMTEPNWGVLLDSPYALQKEFINKAQTQSIFLIIGCIILIILLGIWYSQNIYRNFRQLIKGIQALAEGNYARQIRLITRSFTPYEIVYLTGEFNRMAGKISTAWDDIKQLNLALEEANQKLAKLDDMKSNLIDTVSHELRTPLTSIKGYTSRLIRSYDDIPKEQQLQSLKVVKQQADRLGRLVDDLLVIPELERDNGLRVYPDRVDLSRLLDRTVAVLQGKTERTIEVNKPEAPVLILADPDRMEQVIINVLDNAVKYTDPDRPEAIQISVTPEADVVTLSFWNPCSTIPEKQLALLYEKFQRLDERLTRTTRGTGLGLFITRGLVKAMGGTIQLESDNGFLLRMTIPAYQQQERAEESHTEVLSS